MSKKTEYFGGFFWVAIVSFIVPLFVGWYAFQKLQPTEKPKRQVDASGVDHKIWDYLLKSYVSEGLVDYEGIKKDYLFWDYVRDIGQCNPDALETEDEKLALACNAYNASVIHGVINHKITDSVMDHEFGGKGFFDVVEHLYAGKTVSLNDIEHKMIRPVFKEPRVHVALVCGARSCPAIRAEAYVGDRIKDQLHDQSCLFANSPTYVMYDAKADKLMLSAILNWYGGDFDEKYPEGSYLAWIEKLMEPELADAKKAVEEAKAKAKETDDPDKKTPAEKRLESLQAVQKAIDGILADGEKMDAATISKNEKVSFFKYDWSLNSQADPSKSGGGGGKSGGGFGSGSSPDS